MEMVRYRYRLYGRVQGVGFRYKAGHVADMYRLTGYVKNEYDDSVTVELQGKQSATFAMVVLCINNPEAYS